MTGFAYFYRTYTSTVHGSIRKSVVCTCCSNRFYYDVERRGIGGGHSPFFLNDTGAKVGADTRAREDLQKALRDAIEPVSCPVCGVFQEDMVSLLKSRLGGTADPNAFARERTLVPADVVWNAARKANTIEAYERFRIIWPNYAALADERINNIKFSGLRKLRSALFWLAWISIILFAVFVVAIHEVPDFADWFHRTFGRM